jgi:hypothetical protein
MLNCSPPLQERKKIIRTPEWLLDRVEKDANGCWLWTRSVTGKGYGKCGNGFVWVTTHRLSWETFVGPIPEGKHVLHRCDVRRCINPEHLFLGTNADNVRDAIEKKRASTHWTVMPRVRGKWARCAP